MDKDKTKEFIKSTISELDKMLTSMCDINDDSCKKAELITYWLRDYKRYLEFEQKFTPKKLKTYERGDVLKVNLGFNIGNEEGGLHYAVVIDNNNDQSSGVITIVPLSSIKEDNKESRFDVILGTDLYNKVICKYNNHREYCEGEVSRLQGQISEYQKQNEEYNHIIESRKYNSTDLEILIQREEENRHKATDLYKNITELRKKIKLLKKIYKEITKMKLGTKALVGQITTISKMRIFDPKNDIDILSDIKISPDNLDLITSKIKELYIFNIDKSIHKSYNSMSQ